MEKMDKERAAEALSILEERYGRTPSVKEVADYCKVSPATALRYLDEAVDAELLVKRDGKFLTQAVAEAYKQ